MEAYAFPRTVDECANGTGMLLRDYLAAQALTGLLANGELYESHLELATDAYRIADAMLLARLTGGAR